MKKESIRQMLNGIDEKYIIQADFANSKVMQTKHKFAIAASLLICLILFSAFTLRSFSFLYGDELELSAQYWGNGIVIVDAVNKSEVDLTLQSQIKLLVGDTKKEEDAISDMPCFDGITIKAGGMDKIVLDLSKTYDIDKLEENKYYHLVLTSNNFIVGQKFRCGLVFTEQVSSSDDPCLTTLPYVEEKIKDNILIPLQPYFEKNTVDIFNARHPLAFEYLEIVEKIISDFDKEVVQSVSPLPTITEPTDGSVIFDESVATDKQFILVGMNHHIFDGQYKIVGSKEHESAFTIKAYVPTIDERGLVDIPIVYYFTYEKSNISPDKYAFIHGQLISFEDMEKYKVYEDDKFIMYQVTDLFYTNLEEYVKSVASQRNDTYLDEHMMNRIQNIYDYFTDKDNINKIFSYK